MDGGWKGEKGGGRENLKETNKDLCSGKHLVVEILNEQHFGIFIFRLMAYICVCVMHTQYCFIQPYFIVEDC